MTRRACPPCPPWRHRRWKHMPALHPHLLFGNSPLSCLQTTFRSLRGVARTWLEERGDLRPDMCFGLGTHSKG